MDYALMSDEELAATMLAASREIERRRSMEVIPERMDELSRQLLGASGVSPGDPWIQPQGAHDAYPKGWEVSHSNKVWDSLMSGNVWEPGVSGWREVVPVTEVAEWVAPTGAHDAYGVGDVVLFEGVEYRSLIDANTWSPTAYPQGWELVVA